MKNIESKSEVLGSLKCPELVLGRIENYYLIYDPKISGFASFHKTHKLHFHKSIKQTTQLNILLDYVIRKIL